MIEKSILSKYEFKEVNRLLASLYFLFHFSFLIGLKYYHLEYYYIAFCVINLLGLCFFLVKKEEGEIQ